MNRRMRVWIRVHRPITRKMFVSYNPTLPSKTSPILNCFCKTLKKTKWWKISKNVYLHHFIKNIKTTAKTTDRPYLFISDRYSKQAFRFLGHTYVDIQAVQKETEPCIKYAKYQNSVNIAR